MIELAGYFGRAVGCLILAVVVILVAAFLVGYWIGAH